jgi:uncharacterized protein YjbI with pentapeptide repeats
MIDAKEKLIQLILNEKVEAFNQTLESEKIGTLELQELSFTGLNLVNINLSSADLTGADFSECNLESADLTNANLISTNFSRANMQFCNFNSSNLSGAILAGASLLETDFTEANLCGADLREADFTDSDLSLSLNLPQAKFDKFTKWPDSTNLPEDFDTKYDNSLPGYEDDYDEDVFAGELEDN